MGRTLYLNEGSSKLTVMRDGPSVLIKSDEIADRRIPVRLIGRVIIIGSVRLDADIITLFAEHNVPVIFMTRNSEESVVAIPYNHRLARHYEEQKIFLYSNQNISRYEHWANTKRMTIQLKVFKRLLKSRELKLNRDIGEGNYQLILKSLKPADEDRWIIISEIASNLLRGLIIERLLKADIDPHTGIIHRRHNFGMALDLCYIMGAESDMQSLQFLNNAKLNPYFERRHNRLEVSSSGMRDIIHRFENRKEALGNTIENIIDELFELMRELRT